MHLAAFAPRACMAAAAAGVSIEVPVLHKTRTVLHPLDEGQFILASKDS